MLLGRCHCQMLSVNRGNKHVDVCVYTHIHVHNRFVSIYCVCVCICTCMCIPIVQSFSCVQLFVTPWTARHQASLSFTISLSLLKLMSTESVMLSNHLILSRPLQLLLLIFPSIRVFSSNQLFVSSGPKYWSFSFSMSPSTEHSGLIPLRIDWFDLLAVQGTLKSLL